MKPKYKIGDKVWWVVPNTNLIIRCEITHVDFTEEEGRLVFYDLDEPVGHSVSEDELFDEQFECDYDYKKESLESWREGSIKFINSTYTSQGYAPPDWGWLKQKEKDKDWYLL
jgi:hypothetical protein